MDEAHSREERQMSNVLCAWMLFHNPVSPITSRLQTKGSYTGNCFCSKRWSLGKDEEFYQLDLKMDSSVSLAESAA